MSWFSSLLVALLAGVVALVAGGVVAAWCVDWYHISSREGASGFFVVFTALLSGGAGTLVGLAVARGVASLPGISSLKALGLSVAVVLGVAGAVASAARLLADIPPEIDGDTLLVAVEWQWPAGHPPPRPEAGPGELRLGTLSGSTLRREEAGPLFLDDAHVVDGAWVVPGVAPIFTSRGTPVISALVAGTPVVSVLPPLPRRPGRSDQAWSAWIAIPSAPGQAAAPSAYRFRVLRQSDPVRSQQAGPFTVETIARWFTRFRDEDLQVTGQYRVRRDGALLPGAESLAWVAVVSRAPWTLLIAGDDGCRLIGAAADAAPLPCDASAPAWNLLALDEATTTEPRLRRQWLDTTTFRAPGLYVVGPVLLDTRTKTLSPRGWPSEPLHEQDRPPLALSPDARTMAWFAPGNGYDTEPAIATLRLDTGAITVVPIDRARMRYRTPALDITAAWLDHHFRWVRTGDGPDVLDVRADAALLPHRGALSEARDGEYQTYLLSPGGQPLRDAVVDILLTDLGGVRRDPDPSSVDAPRVEVEGVTFEITYSRGGDEVLLVTYATRAAVMARVAAHLDAVAASGRLDALFTRDTTPP